MRLLNLLLAIFIVTMQCACTKENTAEMNEIEHYGSESTATDETKSKNESEEDSKADIESSRNIPTAPNSDPELLSDEGYLRYNSIGVQNEEKYDNITVRTEKNTYNISETEIKCILTNENVGKGFYYYYFPMIEYKEDNEWIRLAYYPPESEYDEQWYFCAIEGNTTEPNSTITTLFTEYVGQEIIPGEYRLVLFIGPNKYYAEFAVVE